MTCQDVQITEPKVTVTLTKEVAKELIRGFGYYVDNFYSKQVVKGVEQFSTEEKQQAETLLGNMNSQYHTLFGEWAW